MKKKFSTKFNQQELLKYKSKYSKQKKFPPFPQEYEDRMVPIRHTAHLLFIRNKFLFMGLLDSFEDRNLYASWVLLKAYWENTAALGYYTITTLNLVNEDKKEEAFALARKMALGGRGFLTEEMVKRKGHTLEDFNIPNVYTMIDKVDKDFKKELKKDDDMMRELYDTQVAEGGHTTWMGLSIAGKWTKDRSMIPDLKKSWTKKDYDSIINLAVMSSLIFFYYWAKFEEIN